MRSKKQQCVDGEMEPAGHAGEAKLHAAAARQRNPVAKGNQRHGTEAAVRAAQAATTGTNGEPEAGGGTRTKDGIGRWKTKRPGRFSIKNTSK